MTSAFFNEHRDYAHVHSSILDDADVRSLSDVAFRMWVTAVTRGATVDRQERVYLGTAKKVSAWAGIDAGEVAGAVAELIQARFFEPSPGATPDAWGVPEYVQVRNLVRFQTTPSPSPGAAPDTDEAPHTVEQLTAKLRALLDEDAAAHAGLADYAGFLAQVVPQAAETYMGMPGLGDGDVLRDEVLFHASTTYCQQPGGAVAMRSWRAALRQLRAWYGAEAVLFALQEAALQGKPVLPYVSKVAQSAAGRRV